MTKLKNFLNYFNYLKDQIGWELALGTVLRDLRYKYILGIKDSNPPKSLEDEYFSNLRYIFPIIPTLGRLDRKRKVVLLIPSLVGHGIFGGIATAIIFSFELSKKMNLDLRVICIDGGGDLNSIKEFIHDYKLEFDTSRIEIIEAHDRGPHNIKQIDVRGDDIFIATTWWSAYLIREFSLPTKFIYFIQDYEPFFYPNGDVKCLAQETYNWSDKYIPIFNTKLLKDFLVNKKFFKNEDGFYFEPAFDPEVFRSHERKGKKKLFLYARKSVARNMFFLGIQAIKQIFDQHVLDPNEWEVYFAGESLDLLYSSSGVVIKNLGKMTFQEYINFIGSVDLGISLMASVHPSYPPLELAAVGSVVVTNKYNSKTSLDNYSKNILMSDLTVDSIIEQVKIYKSMDVKQIKQNYKNCGFNKSWESSFNKIVDDLKHSL
jgi:hypothetical protein